MSTPENLTNLLSELGAALERTFPEGSDNHALLDLPSGGQLAVLRSEAYERLLADALAWRAAVRGKPDTMSPDEVTALFGRPDAS